MAIGTPLHLGSTNTTTNSTLINLTTVATSPAGNLIIVCAASGGGQRLTGVTDSAGNTYTVLDALTGIGHPSIGIAYCANAARLNSGDTIRATNNSSVAGNAVSAISVSGMEIGVVVDQSNFTATDAASGTSSTVVTTGTLAQANELAIGFIGFNNAVSAVAASGFTAIGGSGNSTRGVFPFYKIVAATTAVSYSATWTGSSTWREDIVTFKASAVLNGAATLNGVSGASAIGTIGKEVNAALTSVPAASAFGTLITEVSPFLLGVQGFSAVGSLGFTQNALVPLSGVAGSSGVGFLSKEMAFALLGAAASASIGNLTIGVSPSLIGVQGYTGIGALATRVDGVFALTGAAANTNVGSLAPGISPQITGAQALLSVGTLNTQLGPSLVGVVGSSGVGSIIVILDRIVHLIGAQADSHIGSISLSHFDNPPPPSNIRTIVLVSNIEDRKIPVFREDRNTRVPDVPDLGRVILLPKEMRAVRLPNVPEVEQSRKSLI